MEKLINLGHAENITEFDKKHKVAVARMKALKIYNPIVGFFKNKGRVSVSNPPFGGYNFTNDEEMDRIKEFESKYDALVYTVIRSYTEFGIMDSYLYVSSHPEEWSTDWDDMVEGYPFAYVYNHDVPEFSEFGTIGVALAPGAGLVRTY